MSTTWNIIFTVVFGVIAVWSFIRFISVNKYIMIKDQQWSFVRLAFVALGILSIINLFQSGNTIYDYIRIIAALTCVTAMITARNGIGEEGVSSNGRLYRWNTVRGWDYDQREYDTTFYFQVDSTNEKKKDNYTTKSIVFDKNGKDYALKFMRLNQGGKYMRMKRKKS